MASNMDSKRAQGGIHFLLAAEQEAQHIVNAARAAKMTRLKQAKEEAGREIAQYRTHVVAEFEKKIAESSGDSGANVKRLEHETESKIQKLKEEASKISLDVVDMLLRILTSTLDMMLLYTMLLRASRSLAIYDERIW